MLRDWFCPAWGPSVSPRCTDAPCRVTKRVCEYNIGLSLPRTSGRLIHAGEDDVEEDEVSPRGLALAKPLTWDQEPTQPQGNLCAKLNWEQPLKEDGSRCHAVAGLSNQDAAYEGKPLALCFSSQHGGGWGSQDPARSSPSLDEF